jgi:uncharacterized protein (TIGR01777 family)
MQIAVTGASGLVGTALMASLRADGHEVRPLVRRDTDDPRAIRWDPDADQIDAASLEGLDGVVHLAGAGIGTKRWSAATRSEVLESRVRGTDLLARTLAGLERPPGVLLSGSAMGYYGDTGDEARTESSPPGDDFFSRLCIAWEAAAQPAIDAGIRAAFLRTTVVLSARGGALGRMLPLFRFGLGGPLGSGRHWWSWITLTDEVGAIRFLLDHDISGPVNLGSPNPVTNAELTRTLGRLLHRPTVLPAPAFALRLVLGAEFADRQLLIDHRVSPEVLTTAGYQFVHPDIESALAAVLSKQDAA